MLGASSLNIGYHIALDYNDLARNWASKVHCSSNRIFYSCVYMSQHGNLCDRCQI